MVITLELLVPIFSFIVKIGSSTLYDEIKFRVPKGEKDIIKAHADKVGESVNGYIKKAVDERMERESTE